MYVNSGCQTVRVVWDYSALLIHSYFVIHHHHHRSCPSRSDDDASGASGVTSDQTPMHRCVLSRTRQTTAAAGLALLSFLAWRLMDVYWVIQRSWFARVNALCNLSCKKLREVAAHFRADF